MLYNYGTIFTFLTFYVWLSFIFAETAELNLIGHLAGWKKVGHVKWIAKLYNKREPYHYLLNDYTTHKEVILFFVINLSAFVILVTVYLTLFFLCRLEIWTVILYNVVLFPYVFITHFVFAVMFDKKQKEFENKQKKNNISTNNNGTNENN